jgi:MFS family permease
VVVWIAFLTYNSVIVGRLLGGTPPQAGALLAVGNLVFGIAASQAGRVTSSFGNRFVPLVLANAVLVTGFTTALLAPGVGVAAVGIAGAGAGLGTILSLYRSILTGLAPESLRGGLVSLSAAAARVTATGTPVAMGGVIAVATPHVGFGKALMLAGLGAALVGGGGGIACLLVASRSPPVRVAQTGATDR